MLLFNVVECERGIVRHVIATVLEHCAQDRVALIKLGRGGNHIGGGVQVCRGERSYGIETAETLNGKVVNA
jgi:hypothetical protein